MYRIGRADSPFHDFESGGVFIGGEAGLLNPAEDAFIGHFGRFALPLERAEARHALNNPKFLPGDILAGLLNFGNDRVPLTFDDANLLLKGALRGCDFAVDILGQFLNAEIDFLYGGVAFCEAFQQQVPVGPRGAVRLDAGDDPFPVRERDRNFKIVDIPQINRGDGVEEFAGPQKFPINSHQGLVQGEKGHPVGFLLGFQGVQPVLGPEGEQGVFCPVNLCFLHIGLTVQPFDRGIGKFPVFLLKKGFRGFRGGIR